MQMKIFRKDDMDQAIGKTSGKIIIRKGRSFRKLKKGTVIPSASIKDVDAYITDYIEKLKLKGFIYAGTVDVTDENPYPIMKNEVCIHWTFDGTSIDDPEKTREIIMSDAKYAGELLSESEQCSMSVDIATASFIKEITLNENGIDWSIGIKDDSIVTIPYSGISSGDLTQSYGVTPFLLMMYLTKLHPDVLSLANSHAEELVPDLNTSAELLPFDVDENVRQLGELLDLCVAPVNWNTVGNTQQQSQDWFF